MFWRHVFLLTFPAQINDLAYRRSVRTVRTDGSYGPSVRTVRTDRPYGPSVRTVGTPNHLFGRGRLKKHVAPNHLFGRFLSPGTFTLSGFLGGADFLSFLGHYVRTLRIAFRWSMRVRDCKANTAKQILQAETV